MGITLITGPANAGKARAVLDAVRLHASRREEPLLVVPTHADAERYRRELAEGGLVLGVRVERFRGLLSEIVRRAGVGDEQLSARQRERALAFVAARAGTAPEPAGRPGYLHALAALVAELEAERVTPRRLQGALAAWGAESGADARFEELGALFAGYHDLLGELGRSDPEQLAARSLDALRRAPALWGATPVLLYGFDDLTSLQLDTVETLGRLVDAAVTVSLPYEPLRVAFAGRAGAFQTLLPWACEHVALPARADYYAPAARAALHHLERGLFEVQERGLLEERGLFEVDRESVDPAGAVSLLEGGPQFDPGQARGVGDPGQAVRLLEGGSPRAELELVAGEIRALLDRGLPPEEIAIAHRAPHTIAELLAEVLGEFEIPFAAKLRPRFANTATGGALCGLLAVACGGHPGMPAPGRLEDLLAWLRAPGLFTTPSGRGADPELADRLEARARRSGIHDAASARALWESEHWPLRSIDHVREASLRGPLALIECLDRELRWLFCAPRRRAGKAPYGDAGEAPDGEAHALVGARRAFAELAELARLAPRLAPSPGELLAILRGLELPGEPPGMPSPREAVAVLDPLQLRARRVRALFLCGLQEGVFPGAVRAQPLLSDEDRRGLAEAGLRLGAPRDALAAERYLLYAAVSRPEELLVLSWHTAGEDGDSRAPSLFLEDICDLFVGELRSGSSRRAAGAAGWPGPGAPPSSWSGRELALAGPRHAPPPIAPLREERLLAELRAERLWSASSLESWAGCPAKWFVERLLRARDLDPDPEPLVRGGLAHAALRDTLEGLRARYGSARLTPARLSAARELLHDALSRHAHDFPLSVAPERIPGVRRRLEADLERYLEHAALQDSPLEPSHLELGFGFAEEDGDPTRPARPGLPPLDLGEGLRLRGRIDRIDLTPAGEVVIYDYKGSRATPADRWLSEHSLQLALYMRAAEQLLQRPAVGGFYQPLSGRDLRARGVLVAEAAVELACVRGDQREQADVQTLLDDTLALARTAAREADAGMLQARPDTCAFGGGGCMYPSICRCER